MSGLSEVDIQRMRDRLFFEGPERNRRLSRYWLLLPLAAVIASAGVVSDSTATVIGAMIVAPLMTPILGIVLAVVLADGANLRRCLVLVVAGAVGSRYGGAVAIIGALLLVVIVPLWINSDRIDKTSVRQSEVQAVAERWANDAGWSVTGVAATGDQVFIEATEPNPAPGLTLLRHDLDAAAWTGLTCESTWPRRASSPCRSRDSSSCARRLRTSPRAGPLALLSSVAGEPAGPGIRCAGGDESCTSWIWEAPDRVMEGAVGNG